MRALKLRSGWILACCALAIMIVVPYAATQQRPSVTQQPSNLPRTAPQVQQVLPTYDGQNVTSVELAGQPELNTAELEPLLAQKANQPFSESKVQQSQAALKNTGRFKAVELEVRPEPKGVRVLFVLQPAFYYGIFHFPGAEQRFPYSRLLQVTNYPPRGAYTPADVNRATESLLRFLNRTGYFEAQVHPEVQVDGEHGVANVIFNVTLNRRAKFGQITIAGTTPEETARLKGDLRSILARLKTAAIRPGKTYSLKTIQNATQYLENSLMKQNYLGARVKLIGATYDPATNRADIAFNVQTGPPVHVKVQGAHLWSWTKKNLLPIYDQNGLDPELIQEGQQNLRSYFQSKGYFAVKIDTKVEKHEGTQTIVYQVTKGPRHKVAEVNVAGNQHLSDSQLMPSVAVKEGGILSHGKYSQSLVRTSVDNLKRVYQADGYSDVKVTPETTTRNGNLVVTFRVDEGQQDIVENLQIEGNETQSVEQLAPNGLKLRPGQPYSQRRANEDRNHIMARYLDLGYLNATFRETVNVVGGNKHRIQVVYHINEGPQVRATTVFTLGRDITKPTLIDKAVSIDPGEPLRENDMLAPENRLYNVGIFDWAEVDPRRTITTQHQEDVVIKVHEAKRNVMTYGFGFEVVNRGGSVPSGTVAVPGLPPVGLPSTFRTSEKTFWGPRGSFDYTRKNLRGRAESLTVAGLAGRLDQRGSITYSDPSFRGTKWRSDTTISGEHNSTNPIFTSRVGQIGFQLQRPLNPDRTQTLFLRYNFSETGVTLATGANGVPLVPLIPPEDQHVRLSTLSASYVRDTRDNVLDAHKGIYETLLLDINPSVLGSNFNFTRLQGQTAYYKRIPANIIWANSIRLGFAKAISGHVPISEQFFSGGGSTLRGFPLNGAGPQNTIPACGNPTDPSTCSLITVPVGGNELLILNSEFRYPLHFIFKNLGFVTFYDGGNVFPTVGFHGQYTNSVGGGLRYKTPVGPIRVDIGHNLNAPPGIKSTQIFVTLGQAF